MIRQEGRPVTPPLLYIKIYNRMRLTLTRTELSPQYTAGVLGVYGQVPGIELASLELPSKDGLPGSCIPPGIYPIVLAPSPKFLALKDPWIARFAGRMPHIIRIPMRTEIMIHWGNHVSDTDGCVLVGMENLGDGLIGQSRMAFELLFNAIAQPSQDGNCDIQVIGGAVQPTTEVVPDP